MHHNRVTPTQHQGTRPCPPTEFLRTGRVSQAAPAVVRYVDEDAEGEARYVELTPERPAASRCL
jgi:hypothetical protein